MRVGVWVRIYADMRGACADGHRHARTCAKHVWILAHWLREFESEWDSKTHKWCVWCGTQELRMTVPRVAEVGCEMFGRGQVQGHVGTWCARSARPRWTVVRKTRKASDFRHMQVVMKSSWCTRTLTIAKRV